MYIKIILSIITNYDKYDFLKSNLFGNKTTHNFFFYKNFKVKIISEDKTIF